MQKTIPILATVFVIALSFMSTSAQTRRVIHRKPVVRKPVAAALAGAIKTPSGLTYLITHKGTGALPKVGQTVTVHYTGTLTDGTKAVAFLDKACTAKNAKTCTAADQAQGDKGAKAVATKQQDTTTKPEKGSTPTSDAAR